MIRVFEAYVRNDRSSEFTEISTLQTRPVVDYFNARLYILGITTGQLTASTTVPQFKYTLVRTPGVAAGVLKNYIYGLRHENHLTSVKVLNINWFICHEF